MLVYTLDNWYLNNYIGFAYFKSIYYLFHQLKKSRDANSFNLLYLVGQQNAIETTKVGPSS